MTRTEYRVAGMTCEHCVAAVVAEISLIPSVTGVEVDLQTGTVAVTSGLPLDPEPVGAAVDEAGYTLVG